MMFNATFNKLMNWTCFKKSPVLWGHFFVFIKGDLLIQVWLYIQFTLLSKILCPRLFLLYNCSTFPCRHAAVISCCTWCSFLFALNWLFKGLQVIFKQISCISCSYLIVVKVVLEEALCYVHTYIHVMDLGIA
jgi:hypothetical protein